jgi:PAS domain S-box-containing protein
MDNIQYNNELIPYLYEGVFVVNRDRKILFWNEGSVRITGYSQEEMVNSYCYQNILQHVDEKGTLLCIEGCPLNATLQDGKIREARVFLKHKDGYRIPVMVKTLLYMIQNKRLSRRLKFLLMNASKNKFITKILN